MTWGHHTGNEANPHKKTKAEGDENFGQTPPPLPLSSPDHGFESD